MKVFLDSNIVRHSARTYRTCDIYFGGAAHGEPLVRKGPIELVRKAPIQDEPLRQEVEALPALAAELKRVGATLLMDFHSTFEIKKAGRFRSDYFHGSEIAYGKRPPAGVGISFTPKWMKAASEDSELGTFLSRIRHPRFQSLAKYAGALQSRRLNVNQLADAYFLWCAEENEADYFLTLDFRLVRSLSTAKSLSYKPRVVTALELLSEVQRA